ncbi:MAG: recombination mediator RecR [Coriobacteriia bacterium]|nr:recombination mediator RecR [Coriobacteriia bacterium]
MSYYAEPIARLLEELERLPGIGPKSAQRLAFHILKADDDAARRLADAVIEVKRQIHFCSRCFNFASDDLCEYCENTDRDATVICVVEEPRDVVAIERTGEFRGFYHVLQGAISPMDGIGPEQLRVHELLDRLRDDVVTEVVIATNPNVEGETTALYLARLIKPLGIKVTRIASGLPVGGDLEYADEVTLGRALEARREM